MHHRLVLVIAILALASSLPAVADCPEAVEAEVQAALEGFLLDGFNTRDPEVWAGTLSYPHCRIGVAGTGVWRAAEDYIAAVDYPRQLATGWDHSEWGSKEVLWCSQNAAFARVNYLRKRADGSLLRSLFGIYTLTRQDDGWGVLARFSGLTPAEGEARAAAEAAAGEALRGLLSSIDGSDAASPAPPIGFPYLRLVDEVATELDADGGPGPEPVACGAAGATEPLLVGDGIAILGVGFADDDLHPPAVYAVVERDGRWEVRGCASFTPAFRATSAARVVPPRVLMIIAHRGFQDEEFSVPRGAFERAGFDLTVASSRPGRAVGGRGTEAEVDLVVDDVRVADYDAVVFVGGVGVRADFWDDPTAHAIAREAVASGKVLSAICWAPMVLARAGVLDGRRATMATFQDSYLELPDHGVTYTGEVVTVDGAIVTGNGPAAAAPFADAVIAALAANRH